MNYKKILKEIDRCVKIDDNFQNAFNEFFGKISPDFPPYVEISHTQSFIDGISMINPELKEDLECYAFEMGENGFIDHKEIKYYRKDYDKYLKECYG